MDMKVYTMVERVLQALENAYAHDERSAIPKKKIAELMGVSPTVISKALSDLYYSCRIDRWRTTNPDNSDSTHPYLTLHSIHHSHPATKELIRARKQEYKNQFKRRKRRKSAVRGKKDSALKTEKLWAPAPHDYIRDSDLSGGAKHARSWHDRILQLESDQIELDKNLASAEKNGTDFDLYLESKIAKLEQRINKLERLKKYIYVDGQAMVLELRKVTNG